MIVHGIRIDGVISSTTLRRRWYQIDSPVRIIVDTDFGRYVITAHPGFRCDGRSGGVLVDPLFPNWGTQLERACVLVHDVLYYDFGISWEDANDLLEAMIIYIGYPRWKASLVHAGVSTCIARRAFGCSAAWEYNNRIFIRAEVFK